MKRCPACGFEDTPTERQMLNRYRRAFGTMPVLAMMKRGWLCCGFSNEHGWPSVVTIRDELKRFFDISDSELTMLLSGQGTLRFAGRLCRIEPEQREF